MNHYKEKIVSLENKNELSQQEELTDIIVPIEERRPYDMASYQLERDLNTILGNETDEGGKLLVNTIVAIFKKMGYEAKNIDGINDNGIDIEVYQKNNKKPYMAIQCKSYTPLKRERRISEKTVRDFNGATADHYKPGRRIFITTSYFDNTAVQKYSDRIILIDRIGLIHLLLKYFPEETINVLNSLSLPQIWDICKKCGHGKLYPIFYNNNYFSVCTNCLYKYDPKTDKYTKQKYKKTTRKF